MTNCHMIYIKTIKDTIYYTKTPSRTCPLNIATISIPLHGIGVSAALVIL